MIAQLMAKIGVDWSDLNKAEVALKSFEKSFSSAFKRAPSTELRTEAALAGSVRQLMAGDVGGAIESITHRLGIMGVAGGTAIAGLIVAFTKAHEAAKKYEEAVKEAEKASKISPAASQGLQALQADLVKTAELQGKIAHDMDSRWIAMGRNVGRLGGILQETFLGGQAFNDPVGRRNEEDRVKNAAILEKITGHTRDNLLRQGDAAANMAEMARAQAAGDEEGVAALKRKEEHAKAMFEAMKNYREVLDSIKDKETRKELKPELRVARGKVEVAAQAVDEALQLGANRRVAMAKEDLAVSGRISDIKEKGLTADAEKNELAEINIKHLEAQLGIMEKTVTAETVKNAKRAEIDAAKATQTGAQSRVDEQLTTEAQIAAVKEKGLSADVERNALALINIQYLTAQLNAMEGITDATRAAKEAEIDRAKALNESEKKKEARAKIMPGFEAHAQLSLQELAGVKRPGWIGGELNRQVMQAQEVQKLMQKSEEARLAGHPRESFALFARAEEFKRGMPMLKESEKSPELGFLSALNASSVLIDMRKYLDTIASAVSKENPFLNK